MNPDLIIAELYTQLVDALDSAPQNIVNATAALEHAKDYLQERGWRLDGIFGDTWLKD